MLRLTTRLFQPGRPTEPQQGQAFVEFALSVMVFLGIILSIFEGARLVASYIALGNAAREGARAGLYVPSGTLSVTTMNTSIRDKIRETLQPWMSISNEQITICRRTNSTASCGSTVVSGSVVDITVNYTFQFLPFAGGWLGQSGIPLTAYHRALVD